MFDSVSDGKSHSEITDSKFFLKRIVEIQTCAWVLVVAGILVHGYLGKIWSEVEVFRLADGWCGEGEGLGRHCFGDFGMNHKLINFDLYIEGSIPTTNTPLTNLFFLVLQKLHYNLALSIYALALISAAVLPYVIGQNSTNLGFRLQVATLFGLISIGTIGAIDRGNHVLILPLLIYGYYVSVQKENWKRATALLILLSLFKFWGIIFIIALIAKSRYRDAFTAVFFTSLLTVGLLIPFKGSLTATIPAMLRAVTDRELGNTLAPFAFSVQVFFRRFICAVESETSCSLLDQKERWVASPYFSVAVLTVLLLLVLLIMRKSSQTPHIWMLTLASVGFLGIPEAPVYQLVVLSGAIAAILATETFTIENHWKWTTWALIVAVVISSTPFNVHSNRDIRLSTLVGDVPSFRSDQWIIPFCWLIVFAIATTAAMRKRSIGVVREMEDSV